MLSCVYGQVFFSTNQQHRQQQQKTSCLLINAVRLGHIFHLKLDPFLLHRSALACCACCIWAHLMPLDSRIIMPFVQKPWPFIAPSSKELVFRSIHKWYVDKHNSHQSCNVWQSSNQGRPWKRNKGFQQKAQLSQWDHLNAPENMFSHWKGCIYTISRTMCRWSHVWYLVSVLKSPEINPRIKSGQAQKDRDPITTRHHLIPPFQRAPRSQQLTCLSQTVARVNGTLTDGFCNDSNSNNKININNNNICPKGIYTQRACFFFFL